jgi:acyl dehydratase
LDYDRILAYRREGIEAGYMRRDAIVYALGIGIGMDPLDPGALPFVYERGLKAFPTLAIVLGGTDRLTDPAFGIDHRFVVVGDQRLVLHRPLPPEGRFTARIWTDEIIDKGAGKHAILQQRKEILDEAGTPVALIETGVFARGQGGFGGRVGDSPEPHRLPERSPDAVCDLPTPPNLALIYRLTGDDNPLHADPAVAQRAGFDRPILHGAASFGLAAHAVLKTVAGDAPERLAAIEARFARPVFPGDTIRTELWVDGTAVSFRCLALERGETVLANGLATLRD